MAKQEMTWDDPIYTFKLKDGRELCVDGDRWSEIKASMVAKILKQRHPELRDDAIKEIMANTEEGDQVDTEVYNEIIDPQHWEEHAIELDSRYDDPGGRAAWILPAAEKKSKSAKRHMIWRCAACNYTERNDSTPEEPHDVNSTCGGTMWPVVNLKRVHTDRYTPYREDTEWGIAANKVLATHAQDNFLNIKK